MTYNSRYLQSLKIMSHRRASDVSNVHTISLLPYININLCQAFYWLIPPLAVFLTWHEKHPEVIDDLVAKCQHH